MFIEGTRISMTRGDTETFTVKCVDNLGPRPFESGDTVTLTVRKYAASPVLFKKTVTTFTEGSAIIKILPIDTATLLFSSSYVYDIQVTFANGDIKTIVKPSVFEILPEVSYE